MNPRVLIARFSRQARALRERTFLSPLVPNARVRIRLEGQVYEFTCTQPFAGWGHFRPLGEREAALIGEAPPAQRLAYLEIFPVLPVVLLWPDPHSAVGGTWWALPGTESDASEQLGQNLGGNSAEPLHVHLCDPANGAEPFARVLARVDGDTLWYDSADPHANPRNVNWLRDAAAQGPLAFVPPVRLPPGLNRAERLALTYAWIRDLDPARSGALPAARGSKHQTVQHNPLEGHARLRRACETTRLEGRVEHALAKADAELHSFREEIAPDGTTSQIFVEWSERGKSRSARRRYRSPVNPATHVVASGIGLNEGDFDLTSLASVAREASN